MEWSDTSPYVANKLSYTPIVWTLNLDPLNIVVHRRSNGDPLRWYVSCELLNVSDYPLIEPDIKGAQLEAIKILWSKSKKMFESLDALL